MQGEEVESLEVEEGGVHVHVHFHAPLVDLTPIAKLVDTIVRNIDDKLGELMSDTQEILDELAAVKASAVETQKDVQRVIAKLEEALTANDLTAVRAAVADLKTTVGDIDAAAEAAVPEGEPSPQGTEGEVPVSPAEGDGSAEPIA